MHGPGGLYVRVHKALNTNPTKRHAIAHTSHVSGNGTLQTADGMGTVTTQTRLAAAAFAFCAFRYPAGGRAVVGIFAESAPAGSKERDATPLVPRLA